MLWPLPPCRGLQYDPQLVVHCNHNVPRLHELLPNLRPTLTPLVLGLWGSRKGSMGSQTAWALVTRPWPHRGQDLRLQPGLLRAEQAGKEPPLVPLLSKKARWSGP